MRVGELATDNTDNKRHRLKKTLNESPPKRKFFSYSFLVALAAFFVLHVLIYELSPHVREGVLLVAAPILFFWPMVVAKTPHKIAQLIWYYPLFGIWLGLLYCDDIGPRGHMFLALPPGFAGIWGLCIGGLIVKAERSSRC